MLASWSLDRVLPQLELNLYDERLTYFSLYVLEDTPDTPRPPDPRFAMAASLDARQSHTRKTHEWGPPQDAQLLGNLQAAGAAGVLFRRDYDNVDVAPLVEELKHSTIGLIGSRLVPFGQTDPHVPDALRAVSPLTSVDGRRDVDRNYRAAYLAVVPPGQAPVPSGALRLLARLEGVTEDKIQYGSAHVRLGERTIPCERDSVGYLVRLRLPMFLSGVRGLDDQMRDYWQPIPLHSLLDGDSLFYRRMRGRVLLVGHFEYTATEKFTTPGGPMPPFRFQACLLDTLLSRFSLIAAPGWQVALLQLGLLLVIIRGGMRSRSVLPVLVLMLVMASYTVLNVYLFTRGQLWPLAGPLLGMIVTYGVQQAVNMYRALGHLLRFGGQTARQAALHLNEGVLFESFERTATILFTNLPDHLKQLEKVGAPELFPRRKEYSRLVIEAVGMHGGQILDYQADFLMVGFNTEQKAVDLEHALNAVLAAMELQRRVHELKDVWLEALDPKMMQAFCGICTGPVALGFVGAREHKKAPAAIGDTTNVAARLLGAAKKMGVEILISELTMELASEYIEVEPLEPVSLKGKTRPVSVYRVNSVRGRQLTGTTT